MPGATGLTYADLASFPDDGMRRELLAGELLVTPSPGTRHQRLVGELYGRLWSHLRAHGGAEVFVAPLDIVLSDSDVVQPDLCVILSDQADIVTPANVEGAPDLVIEVLSDHRRDRVQKRRVYASFAVPEYWIVDPEADRIEIYRLSQGATTYRKPEILEAGDTLTYHGMPGFSIDVSDLFNR